MIKKCRWKKLYYIFMEWGRSIYCERLYVYSNWSKMQRNELTWAYFLSDCRHIYPLRNNPIFPWLYSEWSQSRHWAQMVFRMQLLMMIQLTFLVCISVSQTYSALSNLSLRIFRGMKKHQKAKKMKKIMSVRCIQPFYRSRFSRRRKFRGYLKGIKPNEF